VKTPVFLLFFAVVSCVHQIGIPSHGAWDSPDVTECLSAIADRVTAVPLETNAVCRIGKPEKVVCAYNHVFVLCRNIIYRFNRNGDFQNKISVGLDKLIHDFTVNPDQEQLIVLDNFRQIHFFAFNGIRQTKQDLSVLTDGHTLQRMTYYSHSLWFTYERISPENIFENGLLCFDPACQDVEDISLSEIDLGRRSLHRHFTPEFAVAENKPYVYSPFAGKNHILKDTLYLLAHGQFDGDNHSEKPAHIYPVRIGNRYLIASYRESMAEESNFLFIFDRNNHTSFNLTGLDDDFFQTGVVTDLQPLNPNGSEYYFYKTGESAKKPFPERDEQANPVLFFVRLNS